MKFAKNNLKVLIIAFIFVFSFSAYFLFFEKGMAETADSDAVLRRRQQLEEELKNLETQIEAYNTTIQSKQREATTFERDIAILDAKIEKAKLEIKARNLNISNLADAIGGRSKLIDALFEKMEREKTSLSALIRRVNESDSTSLIELVLGYEKFSDFFTDTDSFDFIQRDLQSSFDEIRQTKTETEQEKEDLENKKSEEMELRNLQELEKKRQEEAEATKKSLLKATKGEEKKYQELLSVRQKDAATIRSQLFMLRGSPAIPFEKALDYANLASAATGIRPAFLLGVIAEESNLGANVGTGNWKDELANSRCASQRKAFIEITASIGLDPDLMPVSRRAWYGYCGGAMGPAQFMPTTWQLYANRISNITGHNPPNPWDPYDSFVAAALLLKDNGAIDGNYAAERKAALKYLAGANWSKSAYSFYGDDVMSLAAKYQEQINILQNS